VPKELRDKVKALKTASGTSSLKLTITQTPFDIDESFGNLSLGAKTITLPAG